MPVAVLDIDAVSFAYGRTPVLDGVSFSVAPGEFVALVGPNGSGKSTLIRILLGLVPPRTGSVELFGSPPKRLGDRRRIGYVPQRSTAGEHLPSTVEEVVAAGCLAGRRWSGRLRPGDLEAVTAALEAVALADRRRDRFGDLSGGQQQRVLIAKALVTAPDLLVLDEPVAGVDVDSQARFRDALVGLVRERAAAVLLVSHELSAVAADLDRIVVLRHGKVDFDGRPDDLAATGVSLGVHRHDLPVWLEE